jgi:hypothetical protein
MGLNEMAIEAWTKAEKETDTIKAIEFMPAAPARATGVRIMKRDRIQNVTEEFVFGSEVRTESKVKGAFKKVVVSLSKPGHLTVKSELPLRKDCKCVLVEHLTLESDDVMHQELVATNLKEGPGGSAASVTIHRYFTRTELPDGDFDLDDFDDDDDE